MSKRTLEAELSNWLSTEELNPRRADAKLERRKAELERLEVKLWDQLAALITTVRKIQRAQRSLSALKRARRKAVRRPPPGGARRG